MPNWENPWPNAVPVRIEHLAEALAGAATHVGSNAAGNPEYMVANWRGNHGHRLDAYVLPGRELNVGIRYGARRGDYLSPTVKAENVEAVRALEKRTSEPGYVVRRTRAYLDHPAGSEARQNAFDDHVDAIVEDARGAHDPEDNPYEGSDEPHEANAWRCGVAETRLGL